MSDFTVNMNEYLPLRDLVFNTLRQAILRGELKPGERLMEIQLAEKLGVSRTPIREAIRKLELEGLVLMIPRRGAEVAKISPKALEDVLEVRGSLEDLAALLSCERITDTEIQALAAAAESFKDIVEDGDEMKIAEADEHFHDIIYESTKNQRLVQILNNLREQMYRYRLEYIKDRGKRGMLIEEHDQILQAIRTRSTEKARELMREHILHQEETVAKHLEEEEAGEHAAGQKNRRAKSAKSNSVRRNPGSAEKQNESAEDRNREKTAVE